MVSLLPVLQIVCAVTVAQSVPDVACTDISSDSGVCRKLLLQPKLQLTEDISIPAPSQSGMQMLQTIRGVHPEKVVVGRHDETRAASKNLEDSLLQFSADMAAASRLPGMEFGMDVYAGISRVAHHKTQDQGIYLIMLGCTLFVNLVLACVALWFVYSAWCSAKCTSSQFLASIRPPTSVQIIIALAYVSLSIGHMIFQHRAGSTGYSFMSATLIVYVGKCVVAFLMFACKSDVKAGFHTLVAPGGTRFGMLPACILPAVPGFLFAAYDALSFLSLANLDPAAYIILVQLRVIWVAVLWQWAFHCKLSSSKWLALFLIIVAGITKGLDQAEVMNPGISFGIYVTIFQTWLNALANVSSEVLLKEMPMPTDLINACTYSWGLVGLATAMLWQQGPNALNSELLSASAWERLRSDPWMIASISSLVVFGIVTAYLLKELSNIFKELAAGFVIIASTVLEWMQRSSVTGVSMVALAMAVLGCGIFGLDSFQKNCDTDDTSHDDLHSSSKPGAETGNDDTDQ